MPYWIHISVATSYNLLLDGGHRPSYGNSKAATPESHALLPHTRPEMQL
jgi:hypothetical protein